MSSPGVLPTVAVCVSWMAEALPVPSGSVRVRVLVVEDERRLAANVARALREGAGYAVDVADDGQEGFYLATSGEYDLLVLDLMLPKLDGQALLTPLPRKKAIRRPYSY